MTRARTHTWAVGRTPLHQPLLAAALFAFVLIASNVAAMFGMRFNRQPRDWHTQRAQEALPLTRPDTHLKEQSFPARRQHAQPSHPLRLVATRRSASPTCFASGGGKHRRLLPPPVATRLGGGGMRALARMTEGVPRSATVIPDARKACEPEPRGYAHHMRPRLLGSRSRYRAPGMTIMGFAPRA